MLKKLGLQFELEIDSEGEGYVEIKRYKKGKAEEIIHKSYVPRVTIPELVKAIKAGDLEEVLKIYMKIFK